MTLSASSCRHSAEEYRVLEGHVDRLRGQIAKQQEICARIETLLEARRTWDSQFTKDEIEALKKRSAELRAAVGVEMERGADPKDPRVQRLVTQITDAANESFGGNQRMETLMGLRPFFANNADLVPQPSHQQCEKTQGRLQKMRKLFSYLRRALT